MSKADRAQLSKKMFEREHERQLRNADKRHHMKTHPELYPTTHEQLNEFLQSL